MTLSLLLPSVSDKPVPPLNHLIQDDSVQQIIFAHQLFALNESLRWIH